MNLTHLEHIVYALITQTAIWLVAGNWWMGAMLAIGLFIGREHAQREYKLGDPSRLKPWEAFDVWNWSRDARLDLVCPVAAVVFVAWMAGSLHE